MIENDDLEYEGQNNPETEYVVDPIDDTKKSIIYGLYSQLSTLENFYSRIQNHYKKVTITWLIAAITALGYLFSQKESNLPIPPDFIALFVLFAAMWGITLLWFIDISIYQTYFYGVITEELIFEKDNKWLPPINKNYIKIQSLPKKRITFSYFYIGCQYILLLLMCIVSLTLTKVNFINVLFIILFFLILSNLITFFMLKVERPKKNPMKKQLRDFLKENIKKKH